MFTLIKNNDNNGVRIKNAQEKLYDYNTLFIDLMKNRGINKVNLTSIGNSIATGFSLNDSLVPLLKRNEDLINRASFDLKLRAYARAQDNCDSKTFHYLNSNITQTEINAYVKNDYLSETVGMFQGLFKKRKNVLKTLEKNKKKGIIGLFKKTLKVNSDSKTLSKSEIKALNEELSYLDGKISTIKGIVDKYYSGDIKDDIGLNDLIKQDDSELANIVVYNGFTGSFLDNWTRKGPIRHFATLKLSTFKFDEKDIYSSLKKIYDDNPNTQVYLCGMPNITGINAVYLKNRKLKKLCKMFPNCVYVGPSPQHFLYSKDGKLSIDIHYSDDEYLKFNKNIMKAIVNNYDFLKAFVKFDLFFKNLHNENDLNKVDEEIIAEYGETSPELRSEYFTSKTDSFFETFLAENSFTSKQLKTILKYYKENYCSNFYVKASKYKNFVIENLKDAVEEKSVDGKVK